MATCAHCGRKLLSHISARCNWCGGEIDDPAYQSQAEAGRAAFFAEQARHDLQTLSIMRGNDPLAPAMTAPPQPVFWQRRAHLEAEPHQPPVTPPSDTSPSEPEDDTKERFDHLEI